MRHAQAVPDAPAAVQHPAAPHSPRHADAAQPEPSTEPNAPALGLGRLVLVPAPLDFGCGPARPLPECLPLHTIETAAQITHWVCENAKSARALLKRIDAVCPLRAPLQAQVLHELPHAVHKCGDHRQGFDARSLLAPTLAGHDVGLLSEAGMPAVADPGASVVAAAHRMGLRVLPLVGPSALLLALAASGMNGQSFAFVGYLPQETQARGARIRALDALVQRSGQTQLAIETPYRNAALLGALLEHLSAHTHLAVSWALSLPGAQVHSASVATWRAQRWALPNDLPAVFAIGQHPQPSAAGPAAPSRRPPAVHRPHLR